MRSNIKIYLSLLVYIFFITSVKGSTCSGTNYYLTEILANESSVKDIFSCAIIFSRNQYTIAVVKHIYRGEVSDTVKIHSGNGGMGSTLIPVKGEAWLIISEKGRDDYYTTMGCYNLSRRLRNSNKTCSPQDTIKGQRSLGIIDQYFNLKADRFTGRKDLVIERDTFAEAYFVEGKADGTWKHYRYNYELKKRPTVAEIVYENGNIEGYLSRYIEEEKPRYLEYQSFTKNGVLQHEIYNGRNHLFYNYPNSTTKITRYVSLNNEGDTIKDYTQKHIDYKNELSQGISFKDGYYFNRRDSSFFYPLAEGIYNQGRKIGLWKYFNKKGETVDSILYKDNFQSSNKLIVGGERNFRYEGRLENGRRIGLWKTYYDDVRTDEYYYSSDLELQMNIKYYVNQTRVISPYKNGKIHGVQTKIDTNQVLIELCEYKNGIRHGRYIRYDEDGKIIQESIFKNNRETTVFSTSTNAPKVNGFSHGYNVQLAGYTDWKMYEGEINMGRNVGKHIQYRKDGSISAIIYYPTMKEIEERSKLANPCEQKMTVRREYYNEDGKLITWE